MQILLVSLLRLTTHNTDLLLKCFYYIYLFLISLKLISVNEQIVLSPGEQDFLKYFRELCYLGDLKKIIIEAMLCLELSSCFQKFPCKFFSFTLVKRIFHKYFFLNHTYISLLYSISIFYRWLQYSDTKLRKRSSLRRPPWLSG